jgi:hypothetical protein
LSSTLISSISFSSLFQCFLGLATLEELDLDFTGCHFQALSAESILGFLEQLPISISLNLSKCDLSKDTVLQVAKETREWVLSKNKPLLLKFRE